jgi:hypothetical protein
VEEVGEEKEEEDKMQGKNKKERTINTVYSRI